MNGKIKVYKDEKGYGFILGEDGQDYFFHISNVKSVNSIRRGDNVDFEIQRNEKGYFADNIKINNILSNKFISFGNVRVNKANIKNYGISREKVKYIKIYQKEINKIFGLNLLVKYEWNGELVEFTDEICYLTEDYNGMIGCGCKLSRDRDGKLYCLGVDFRLQKDDFVDKIQEYLYVTTYQGDNFKFFENKVNFKISDKLKELDDIFSVK